MIPNNPIVIEQCIHHVENSPLMAEELYKNLQNQFYVNVPLDLSPEMIQGAITSMEKYTALAETSQDPTLYLQGKIAENHRRGEYGLYYRTDDEDKLFFHYHPAILKNYPTQMENPLIRNFILQADSLWRIAAAKVKEVLISLEAYFPGLSDTVFKTVENEDPHLMLRFLIYKSVKNELLAQPHFDAGVFTLAIGESLPGLRIGSGPSDLKLVEAHPHEAIFMVGANVHKILPQGTLVPSWHDVIRIEDPSSKPKSYERWAVVLFINAYDVEGPSQEETRPDKSKED